MLCCLKATTASYFINILSPEARRHVSLTLCMLFALCTIPPLRRYSHQTHSSHGPQPSSCAFSFQTSSSLITIHLDNAACSVEKQTSFFSPLALHLISVNAQFLFSSTRHSLFSHPPSKLSAQLGVYSELKRKKKGENNTCHL